jgi:hypothetical protein
MKYTQPETRQRKINRKKQSSKDIRVNPYPKGVICLHYSPKPFNYLVFFSKLRSFLCKN